MFFIVPSKSGGASSSAPPTPKAPKSSLSGRDDDELTGYYPRRTPRACDRCRLKKARCSGGRVPCRRCLRDGVICFTTNERNVNKRQMTPGYIHLIETQRDLLLQAVQKLRRTSDSSVPHISNAHSPVDMNSLFEELNIPQRISDDLPLDSKSVTSHVAELVSSTTSESTRNAHNFIPQSYVKNDETFPFGDVQATDSLPLSNTGGDTASGNLDLDESMTQLEFLPVYRFQSDCFDYSTLPESMLASQWAEAGENSFPGFDMDNTMSFFPPVDGSQQQPWQENTTDYFDMDTAALA